WSLPLARAAQHSTRSSRGDFNSVRREYATWSRAARSAQIGAPAEVNGLARDVARARTAEEAHRGSDVLGRAALAREGVMDGVVRRLRPGARSADQPRRHEVDRDLVGGEIVRQRAREADQAHLGADHVDTVRPAGVGRKAADVHDRAGAAPLEM